MKIGRLFFGLRRTSEMATRTYTVASWSYETGYWRWAIWWTPPKSLRELFKLPRVGPSMASGTKWKVGGHVSFWSVMPFIGSFWFTTQPRFDEMKYCRRAERA